MRVMPKKVKHKSVANIQQFDDDITKNIIFKFLMLYYPIGRIKIRGKFKRAIFIDCKTYSISNEKNRFLKIIISKVSESFNITEFQSKDIVFEYFKL